MTLRNAFGAFVAALLFAGMAALAFAASPNSVAAAQKTSLWKVSSGARALYITGTTQLLTKLDYPLPKPIVEAFAQSQGLLLEGDPGAEQEAITALVKRQGTLPAGETLMGHLNAAQQKALTQALTTVNVPLDKVNRLQPWLAALELMKAALGQLGITPEYSETEFFYAGARKRKIPIHFLETASAQIRLFAGLPDRLQVQWLMLQVSGLPNIIGGREKIVDAWRNGDSETLAKLIHGNLAGKPALYKALVTTRNDVWEQALRSRLARGGPPLFVLVGVGNLIGNNGLIARLRADGYTVVQL